MERVKNISHLYVGIVVTIVLIEPILNLLNINIDEVFALNDAEYKEYEYDENLYENTLKNSYEEILKNDVIERLKSEGYKISNVEIKYNDETLEPEEIHLKLEYEDGYVQPIKIEVSNSESSVVNTFTKNKIKNIINEIYGVKKENIYILWIDKY